MVISSIDHARAVADNCVSRATSPSESPSRVASNTPAGVAATDKGATDPADAVVSALSSTKLPVVGERVDFATSPPAGAVDVVIDADVGVARAAPAGPWLREGHAVTATSVSINIALPPVVGLDLDGV